MDIYKDVLEFAEKIKADPDPCWTLIGRSQQYYAAFDFIKGKKDLHILDVGCGYGYMSAALSSLKHKVYGIDISDHVISEAKRIFGEGFYKAFIDQIRSTPFDLILALEVIEHIPNPLWFMQTAKSLLTDKGSVVVTTPDRKFFEDSKAERGESMMAPGWAGEMPPIHLAIYSKDSMRWIAKELDMDLTFTDFPGGQPQTIGAVFTKK